MNAALFTGLCRFSRWRACCRWWLGRLCPWSRNEPPDLANRRFTVLDDRRIVRGDPNREGEREPGNTAARARGGGPGPPHPEAVTAPVFDGSEPFFSASDKVQVKYEMLRAHVVDGIPVAQAAAAHGYSRAAFYLVAAAFAERGMQGLVDQRRGRRGPTKLTPPLVAFLAAADPAASGAVLAAEVERRFGVRLHRRTVERARRR